VAFKRAALRSLREQNRTPRQRPWLGGMSVVGGNAQHIEQISGRNRVPSSEQQQYFVSDRAQLSTTTDI